MKNQLILSIIFSLTFSLYTFSQEAISVAVHGDGDPVLFLPGFANSSEVWNETTAKIEGTFEYHLVDYAGFNGKEPIQKPWLPQVNTALIDYIQSNKLTNLTIIGHSLGGTIAAYLAAELKTHVKQIVIVDALPHTAKLIFPNLTQIDYENPFSTSQLTMDKTSFKAMIEQQVKMMAFNEEKQPNIIDWILNTDRETYVYGYIDYLNFNATSYLEQIECPVYIFGATSYGEEQSRLTYADQYKTLKNYNLKMAPNSAHYIMYDQPEWFYQNLNLALNE
ncbi:alpha/beta fold hydrolase [Psychroflexus montanilacus]|uniref:alpha/beta fold hydrolase n=1 Tax=Psychroflexus montanilacus TaxID=2873598 RepID=UPI001CCC6C2B|nr:alpha/beta hydrolase [Psychroflexus montanilacus]MBZ9651897.1 alpha/beta hydrolase [Psychroflexus montanilacus]